MNCCCKKLAAKAGVIQEPGGRGMSALGSRCQATTSEDVTGH